MSIGAQKLFDKNNWYSHACLLATVHIFYVAFSWRVTRAERLRSSFLERNDSAPWLTTF
jgi:hypothetical protein